MNTPPPGHLAAFGTIGGGSVVVLLFLTNMGYMQWHYPGTITVWSEVILLLSAISAATVFGLSALILWRLPPLPPRQMRTRAVAVTLLVAAIIALCLLALWGWNRFLLPIIVMQITAIAASAVLAVYLAYAKA